jgi:hypothetical protein
MIHCARDRGGNWCVEVIQIGAGLVRPATLGEIGDQCDQLRVGVQRFELLLKQILRAEKTGRE